MDYEKKYKEALERAREWYDKTEPDSYTCIVESIFPELKESEDENIRKELISHFKETRFVTEEGALRTAKWIAWLEKQGEQKPNPYSGVSFEYNGNIWGMCARDNGIEIIFDGELKAFLSSEKSFIYPIHPQPKLAPKSALEAEKEEKVDNANKVKPKFKESNWITNGKDTIQITIVDTESCHSGYYRCFEGSHGFGWYVIDIESADKNYHLWTIADAKCDDVLVDDLGNICIYQEPSTKLMYHSYCYGNHKHFIDSGGSHEIEGTYPATKEQRDTLFQKMHEAGYMWDSESKQLLSLKAEPCANKQKPVLSEEDKRIMSAISQLLKDCESENDWNCVYSNDREVFFVDIEMWLQSLKDRLSIHQNNIGGDDEINYRVLQGIIRNSGVSSVLVNRLLNWLESLKDKYTWKPSKRQIIALRWILNNIQYNKHKEEISALLDQIKDL